MGGIDKLNLTTNQVVDFEFLQAKGYEIKEDERRRNIFKYFCKLEKAELLWCPHKFSSLTNLNMIWSKIDINPKYFDSFKSMYEYLCFAYNKEYIPLDSFNVSRIDICSDIEGLPMDVVHARLYANQVNRRSFTIYKGQTIYIGANPKIRVYDKTAEIKYRLRKGYGLTDWEKIVIAEEKQITRLEIVIRGYKGTLRDLLENPYVLADYFDKLGFYDLGEDEAVLNHGGLQFLLSKVNRKFRTEFDKYKDEQLLHNIKCGYLESVLDWFGETTIADIEGVPF